MALSGNQTTKVAGYMAGVGKKQVFSAKAGATAWHKIALEGHKPSFTDATFTNFGLDAEEMHRYMYMMS